MKMNLQNSAHPTTSQKVYLMILDGFGEGKDYPGNAIRRAKMPHFEKLKKEYPFTFLQASGEAVGLPEGTMGNSEVGHFTMGMGRIVFQSLEEINRSIKNKTFFSKRPFLDAIEKVKNTPGAALHLLGMISDQGVHSHLNHLFALLELAYEHKVLTYIHAITDGRDVPERTAKIFLQQIQAKITELNKNNPSAPKSSIVTIIGRYFAMDRDQNWDRTEKAYNLYTLGKGTQENDPLTAIENAYKRGIKTDYYIDPIVLNNKGLIKEQDSVIFWNYRTDRTRQITQVFTGESNIGFIPQEKIHPFFVCFGDYSNIAPVVFPTPTIKNNLGEVIEHQGLKQLRIAETEKYAHVSYFFNSQVEKAFPHENRVLIESPKVASYAQKPEMSAREVTQKVLEILEKNDYPLVIQNFANTDLVGHSGDLQATIQACEVIDECIGRIAKTCKEKEYVLMITADHGNAEEMVLENGDPWPGHTSNPVIFLLASPLHQEITLKKGGLQDVAPTILAIMGIEKPKEMTGNSLIKNTDF